MNIKGISLSLLLVWGSAMAATNTVDISAHRGDSGNYAGNSRQAFVSALYGAGSSIEFDIHLTATDKKGADDFIVYHDYLLHPSDFKNLEDLTLIYKESFDWIRKLKYQATLENLPSLDEFFHFHRQAWDEGFEKYLHIEVKLKDNTKASRVEHIAKRLVEDIKAWNAEGFVLIRSFNWKVLKEIKALAPELPLVLLVSRGQFKKLEVDKIIKEFNPCRISPRYKDVTAPLVEKWKSRGVRVSVYTVNKTKYIRPLIEMGVQEITTDHPDKFVEYINEKNLGVVEAGPQICNP